MIVTLNGLIATGCLVIAQLETDFGEINSHMAQQKDAKWWLLGSRFDYKFMLL